MWIISAHLPPVVGCTQASPAGVCPWIRLNRLSAGQGYRIDGAAPGDQLGTSLAGVGDQNGDGIRDVAIGAAGASPNGRAGSGEVVVVQGQTGLATRNLAVTPPLQTIYGPVAGAGLGASLSAAGNVGGDGREDFLAGAPGEAGSAGAAYLVIGAAGTTSDLAQAAAKIAPAGAGSMTGSTLAAGFSLDGGGADSIVSAPGANGSGAWFVVGGSGTPVLPPPPGTPGPPGTAAPAAVAPAAARLAAGASRDTAFAAVHPSQDHGGNDDAERARGHGDHDDADDHGIDDRDEDRRQGAREEKEEEAAALPGQEGQDEVQDRQGQAREGQTGALPPAPEDESDREERVMLLEHPRPSAHCAKTNTLGS